jgi:hypothetical protein
MSNFKGARMKLSIGSLEDKNLDVTAQYNPKELPVSKAIDWKPHAGRVVEYGDEQGRELTVELLFDGYEAKRSVMTQLLKLDQMSSPIDRESKKASQRRPHRCVMVWGDKMERIACVITSVDTKLVMWNDDGLPVRAIATVKLKEIDLRAMIAAELTSYQAQPGMFRVS